MKRSLLILLLVCVAALSGYAQKSPVDEADKSINSIPRKGQQVSMQLDSRRVEVAWLKQLTDKFGSKVKNNKGVLTLDGVVIEEIAPNPIRVISKVDASPTGTTVWWSIDLGNAYLGKEATPVQWKRSEEHTSELQSR